MWKFLLWLLAKIVEWFLRRRRPKPKPKGGFVKRVVLWLVELLKKLWRRRRR